MWIGIYSSLNAHTSYEIGLSKNHLSTWTNCTEGVQWMWFAFGQCAIRTKEIVAVIMGMISVVAWIFNGTPQIVENCKTGLPDKAVSPFLLLFWTVGDLMSLIGGLLTSQLFLQITMAVYSIFSDTILIGQFLYYRSRHKQLLAEFSESEVAPLLTSQTRSTSSFSASSILFLICFFSLSGTFIQFQSQSTANQMGVRRLLLNIPTNVQFDNPQNLPLALPFFPSSTAYAGYVLGWCSSIMYLSSRIPQIFQNWRRGSTKGLSIYLFVFALLGNTSYGLQIFLTSSDPIFLLRALPWILGSIGVLILDLVIFCQFYFYRNQRYSDPVHSD